MEVASRFTLFTQYILEWANELLSKMLDGVDWSGYPLDCYDYKSTCSANKTWV